MQLPAHEQSSARAGSQATQADPSGPQLEKPRAVQTLPAQQPVEQLPMSQTHWPLSQRCPVAQGPPVAPQTQAPVAEQLSARRWSQVVQAAPRTPQLPGVRGRHAVPVQQPSGQPTPSQTHCPATQCCPALQGKPAPQTQPPVTEQPSAVTESQAVQAPPNAPQVAKLRARQVAPSQQPLPQLSPSHTQRPVSQRCPSPQGPPVVPQTHCPPVEQRSALAASQVVQAPPAVPQALGERGRH